MHSKFTRQYHGEALRKLIKKLTKMVYQGNNLAIDPCPIKYKSAPKKKDFNKTILDSTDLFIKKKISCPKFSGTGGIEGLLWVEESYRKIAKKFKWNDGPKLFDNFDMVVEEGAADHWETIIDGKQQTIDNFNACMD